MQLLSGNVINIQTGKWTGSMSGVGAGLDSVYEYLLKSAIVFGDGEQFVMFTEIYKSIREFLRKGYALYISNPCIHFSSSKLVYLGFFVVD